MLDLLLVFSVLRAILFALVFVLSVIGDAVEAVFPDDWSDAERLGLLAALLWLRPQRNERR